MATNERDSDGDGVQVWNCFPKHEDNTRCQATGGCENLTKKTCKFRASRPSRRQVLRPRHVLPPRRQAPGDGRADLPGAHAEGEAVSALAALREIRDQIDLALAEPGAGADKFLRSLEAVAHNALVEHDRESLLGAGPVTTIEKFVAEQVKIAMSDRRLPRVTPGSTRYDRANDEEIAGAVRLAQVVQAEIGRLKLDGAT